MTRRTVGCHPNSVNYSKSIGAEPTCVAGEASQYEVMRAPREGSCFASDLHEAEDAEGVAVPSLIRRRPWPAPAASICKSLF